mmetsp:Transcript_18877/g.40634  ORF Transcript_18877/g.40634 Transcript_18877/m.40634 type:complete len:121 (+) Transcript_18877:2-364(+)
MNHGVKHEYPSSLIPSGCQTNGNSTITGKPNYHSAAATTTMWNSQPFCLLDTQKFPPRLGSDKSTHHLHHPHPQFAVTILASLPPSSCNMCRACTKDATSDAVCNSCGVPNASRRSMLPE